MANYQQPYIIVTGDIIHGFDFYGPYKDQETAIEDAETEFGGMEWHIVKLDSLN